MKQVYYYISCDANNLVTQCLMLSGPVNEPTYIEVGESGASLVGSIYNPETGECSVEKYRYNEEGELVAESELQWQPEPVDEIGELRNLVADLTEVVLLGGAG